jgi:hypothetical protein
MNREQLNQVIHGQSERNILEKSKKTYLSKCKVMTKLLNNCEEDIRLQSLDLDINGNCQFHTGLAAGVMMLKMPMEEEVAKILFALISVDDTLPRKKKDNIERVEEGEDVLNDDREDENSMLDIGKNKVTVTAQTYQNYK